MKVHCTGGASFYGRRFKCWVVAEHRTHGITDLSKAIYQSCDVFFYTLAEKLGIERIAKYAMASAWGRRLASICRRKSAGSCRRKNGRSAISSRSGMPAKLFQWASGRAPWRQRRCSCCGRSEPLRWTAAWCVPHVTDPTGFAARDRAETSNVPSDVKNIPIDPRGLGDLITDAMAGVVQSGRHGALCRTCRASILRERRGQRADHQQRVEGQDGCGGQGQTSMRTAGLWGSTPRRDPEIVVVAPCWKKASTANWRPALAAQVIKAYVDKQRRQPTKMAQAPAKWMSEQSGIPVRAMTMSCTAGISI